MGEWDALGTFFAETESLELGSRFASGSVARWHGLFRYAGAAEFRAVDASLSIANQARYHTVTQLHIPATSIPKSLQAILRNQSHKSALSTLHSPSTVSQTTYSPPGTPRPLTLS